jgi:hypothetical protein
MTHPLRFLLVALVACGVSSSRAPAQDALAKPSPPSHAPALIRNHAEWRDTEGNLIDCHEGGILRVGEKYYWYGRSYHGNDKGIYGTGGAGFRCGLNCYSSANLVDWTFEGNILSYPDSGWITEGTWHRPRVLYNEKSRKYVLWFFCLGTPGGRPWVKDVVAVADRPIGPFTILGERAAGIDPSGDLALLLDADGRAYMANGDWKRNGLVVRLTDDYQDIAGDPVIALPAHREGYEGLSLTRFKGKYILAGSGVAGLDPTDTTYAVADAPMGPYTVKGLLSEQKTWRSQISSFCHIPETDTLFALCEQWLTGPDGRPAPAERSTQLWLPVTFDPQTGIARMRYVEQWDPQLEQK